MLNQPGSPGEPAASALGDPNRVKVILLDSILRNHREDVHFFELAQNGAYSRPKCEFCVLGTGVG